MVKMDSTKMLDDNKSNTRKPIYALFCFGVFVYFACLDVESRYPLHYQEYEGTRNKVITGIKDYMLIQMKHEKKNLKKKIDTFKLRD